MKVEAAPSRRILIVLTGVITQQPVTFTELVKTLPVSRSGVWHALETLTEMNWIIKRNGDGAYRVSENMSTLLRGFETPTHGSDLATGVVRRLKAVGFDAEYGQFTSLGHFQILDSSRALAYGEQSLSMVTDDMCLAAQALMPMSELLQHLREFQEFARPEDQMAIHRGEHAQITTKVRQEQIAWSADNLAFSVGAGQSHGASGAIRIYCGSNTTDSLESAARSVPKTGDLQQLRQWIDGEL